MKKIAVLILFTIITFFSYGQIINPAIEKSEVSYCKISKIEKKSTKTVVYFEYTSPNIYVKGGWVCVGKEFFIRDIKSRKKYNLLKANNIPVCPSKHNFEHKGQLLSFNLEFEPIPVSLTKIDIIESEANGGFNFYGVSLNNIDNLYPIYKTLYMDGRLRKSDHFLSDVIQIIPKGKQVKIISGPVAGIYKAQYNGKTGYINEFYFAKTTSTKAPSSSFSSSNKNASSSTNCDNIKYIPPSKKPSFNNYLAGIKTVVVVAHKFDNYVHNKNYRYHLFSSYTVLHKAVNSYLKELGFQKIIFLEDMSDVVNYTSCDNTFFTIVFNLDVLNKNPYSNFKMFFVSLCNEYSWDFVSYRTAQSNDNSIKLVLRSMYNIRKSPFNSSAVIQLQKWKTCWTETKLKEAFRKDGCKSIEGLYENTRRSSSTAKYKVAVREFDGKYHLIYISGANNPYNWKEGEIKAYLEETATPFYFKAKWIMANKTTNEDFYVSFEKGIMSVVGLQGDKSVYLKLFPSASDEIYNPDISSSGTGFALSSKGYIATNYHVVKNAASIKVRGINGDFSRSYNAKIVLEDQNNDLAIIKINDTDFSSIGTIPYIFKSRPSDVGKSIFVLGYPLRATMGDEIKITDGIISSKSGYQGDITSYQISAPVQPGNSGGPLFDNNGNLIGIINAKHTAAENASYAVKTSYLLNLIDLLPSQIQLPYVSKVNGKSLPEQVKIVKMYIYIIEIN